MARSLNSEKTSPDHLTLKLNAPGMTAMHRAGLGGLAATLARLTICRNNGEAPCTTSDPLWHDEYDWSISPIELSLRFGKPEWAGDFMEWLFKYAFQIRDEMIFLPGQYGNTLPPPEVRARLQEGIMLTFLQNGKSRELGPEVVGSYEYDQHMVSYKFSTCISYATHQSAWIDWVDKKTGRLIPKSYKVSAMLNPGAVVRHYAFKGPTTIYQSLELVFPLVFAIVGTLALPINYETGVLIIPYIDDLITFARLRRELTPSGIKDTNIGGIGDAVLQHNLRCMGSESMEVYSLPGCDAIRFQRKSWSKQQKTRSDILSITSIIDSEFYAAALKYFPPYLRKIENAKNSDAVEENKFQWLNGIIRPFIADNIVRGRCWFAGFTKLMKGNDTVSRILFERKRLNKMVTDEQLDWKMEGARSLVIAVHQALRCRYGQISSESVPGSAKNRMEKEYDRWRIAFAGSKTQEQFRYSLCDLFSRAKTGSELKEHWEQIIRLLQCDWLAARDLALIGLASYKGRSSESPEEDATSSDEN